MRYCSYSILAAEAAKSAADEKAASVAVTDSLCNAGSLKDEEFKIGLTKVINNKISFFEITLLFKNDLTVCM